jgi:hypothetical protein
MVGFVSSENKSILEIDGGQNDVHLITGQNEIIAK